MTRIFHLVLAVGVIISGSACTMVGTGTRTVIKEQRVIKNQNKEATDFIRKRYPHLLAYSGHDDNKNIVFFGKDGAPIAPRPPLRIGKSRMPRLPRPPQPLRSAFRDYMEAKYGGPNFEAARLTVSVRDRGKTPAFLPTEAVALAAKNTATLITADSGLTDEERIKRQKFLEARLLNTPDLPQTTTLHHTDKKGRKIYYYYPRIEIDFSAQLLSATNLDRFSFLGLVMELKPQTCSCPCSEESRGDTLRPRFINFAPKAADFAEFTRGQFNQNSQMQARATYGSTQGSTVTTNSPSGQTPPSIVTELARKLSLGVEGSYTYSEGVVRELKDAIQRRATGLDCQGQVFFAEYRSINAIRIGGTYNFDLMLEVPAYGRDTKNGLSYVSDPVAEEIRADIYLVGVVRHVYDRGETGIFLRNPETENDHVYEQVVLQYQDELLWEFNGVPWKLPKSTFTLNVLSNREEARFVVKKKHLDPKKVEAYFVVEGGCVAEELRFAVKEECVDEGACFIVEKVCTGEKVPKNKEARLCTDENISKDKKVRFVVEEECVGVDEGTLFIKEECVNSTVIANGSGNKTKITLPREEYPYYASVEFLTLVDTGAKSGPVELRVEESSKTFCVSRSGGQETVVGTYGLPDDDSGE